jgi:hypothetical protein
VSIPRLTFSFDLDGVLWERPEVFRPMIHALVVAGHDFGVLAGFHHSKERVAKIRERLKELGYPEPSFVFGRTDGYYMDRNGAVHKSDKIRELGVDLHFDDYDFDHPDTIRLFAELGQEGKVARIRSAERREFSANRGAE